MSLRQQNKQRARANIISAAQTLIAEEGVDAATTREIAKRAGVSYQTLYNYFPTKADIAGALLETETQLWARSVDDIVKRFDGDLADLLVRLLRDSLQQINGPNKELWGYLALSALKKEVRSDSIGTAFSIAHEHFHALLSLAQGMGYLRRDLDLHLMANALFNLMDYAMLRYFIEPIEDELFIRNQREMIELLINPYLQKGAPG
ncbi:MAG: TetR/AcrR family transcriptional regulator [Pseudomonadota bacterium]